MIQKEQFQTLNNLVYDIYKAKSEEEKFLDVSIFTDTANGNIVIYVNLNERPKDGYRFRLGLTKDSSDEEINKAIDLLSVCREAISYSLKTDGRKSFEEVQQRKLKEFTKRILSYFQ